SLRTSFRRSQHRFDVVVVVRAAAQVARHSGTNFICARVRVSQKKPPGAHELPGRAKTALRAVMLDERLLQRIEPAVLCETLDGLHRPAIGPHSEVAARVNGPAVQQNRAGAAFATVAANLCSGQAEVIAQKFNQRPSIFYFDALLGAVYGQSYRCPGNRLGRSAAGRRLSRNACRAWSGCRYRERRSGSL